MPKRNHEIDCPMCEAYTIVEVVNTDEVPEHCPICGHPLDPDEEYMEDE